MDAFVAKHEKPIRGVLSCFDRVLFRGYVPLMSGYAMAEFLKLKRVQRRTLKPFLLTQAGRVKQHALAMAVEAQRPHHYLTAPTRKEELARQIAERHGITEGLVCVFSVLEPCWTFSLVWKEAHPFVKPAWRKCLRLSGSVPAAGPGPQHPAPATQQPATVIRREGDYWTVVFEGRVARLKDAKGLQYIAYLLRHPGEEFHVSQLIAAIGEAGAEASSAVGAEAVDWDARASSAIHERGLGDAGVVLDAKAKAEYKRRIDDLRGELEEAVRFNDPGRAQRAREEIEMISEQLTAAVGLGGRDRHAASDAEPARLAVTKRIKAALTKIRDANPDLARHLDAAITTGYFCSYAPKADTPTSWPLE